MKTKGYLIFTLSFLLLLSLPALFMLCGYQAENKENRPLARQPELVSKGGGLNLDFPLEFDRYFEDHFGLREEMVSAFHALTMRVFSDTLNEQVIVGKEGMLFFHETLRDYMRTPTMSDADIARAAIALRLQREYVHALGASFAFCAAPNKNTIYPEYMPNRFVQSAAESNRERLYAALKSEGVQTVDLVGALLPYKSQGLLYHMRDTHWNDFGAIVAYTALMQAAFSDIAPPAYIDLKPVWENDYAGDLHYFVLPSVPGYAPYPRYFALDALQFAYDDGARPKQDIRYGTHAYAYVYDKSLYMMRDSFTNALLPLVSANTRRAVYSSAFPYQYTDVAQEKPDAVLIELVERNIPNLIEGAPLMPALNKDAPPIPGKVMRALYQMRTKNGYTELIGAYEGELSRVYIVLEGEAQYCFEAFPILEEEMHLQAAELSAPQGFALTLPQYVRGTYTLKLITEQGHCTLGKITL